MQQIKSEISDNLGLTVRKLSEVSDAEMSIFASQDRELPSIADINEIIGLVKKLIFPEIFRTQRTTPAMRKFHIGVAMERLFYLLKKQISACLVYYPETCINAENVSDCEEDLTADVISQLPEIKRKLYTDIHAICSNDPSVVNEAEVIFCYPAIKAMMHYRLAHVLQLKKVPLMPRIISEIAHSETGIDIHPGAEIGEHFAIDHGTGIVIGETCIIGRHVTIYQGVTLGAKNFTYDNEGNPLNVARHPIIEDNVTIYSNASVLGRITIGHDSVIGGNVWVTNNVPPHSKILQGSSRSETFTDGAGI